MDLPSFYTVDEVAGTLRVTKRTVYQWIQDNRLAARKVGKYWRISYDDLRQFLGEPRPIGRPPKDRDPTSAVMPSPESLAPPPVDPVRSSSQPKKTRGRRR